MGPKPCDTEAMHHALIMHGSGAWAGICYTLNTCKCGACEAEAMPSLHAASELVTHEPHLHSIQFWSLHSTLHATIKCNSWGYEACGMFSLNAISNLWKNMPWPQLLICNTLSYFILYSTLGLISLKGPEPWCPHDMHDAFITCSSGALMSICNILLICSSGACEAYGLMV